jgi:hypothetical protein
MAFRKQYGLRSDEEWVRSVASDPAAQAAIDEFGVPLTPEEERDLLSRRVDPGTLEDIQSYGRLFPEEYAGAYINQATAGFVVSFKSRIDRHRAALDSLFPKAARIEIRKVQWSTMDLNRFAALVEADSAWFQTINVRFITADRSIKDDFVTVRYQGPMEAATVIEAHYGNPSWIRAESAGNLPWTGLRGDLALAVTDANGNAVSDLWCDFAPDNPLADEGAEEVITTAANGRCEIPMIPAGAYTVTLRRFVSGNHYEPIAKVRAVVVAGGRTVVPVLLP